MSLTARDLNAALWAAADEMRQVMSADVYKDYLLGLVFYKALSDKILVEAYELLNDTKPERLEEALQKPSLILRPENFYLLHRPNFCANDCSGYF